MKVRHGLSLILRTMFFQLLARVIYYNAAGRMRLLALGGVSIKTRYKKKKKTFWEKKIMDKDQSKVQTNLIAAEKKDILNLLLHRMVLSMLLFISQQINPVLIYLRLINLFYSHWQSDYGQLFFKYLLFFRLEKRDFITIKVTQ